MGALLSSLRSFLRRAGDTQDHDHDATSSKPDLLAAPGDGDAKYSPPSGSLDEPDSVPAPTTARKRPSFALIIGINDYINCQRLVGAVPDAKAMEGYLKVFLGVPKDHIRMLLDRQATRETIIQAFKNLRTDPRINHGDSIVIFFAGHGGEMPAPPSWGSESEVQCLVPCDYKLNDTYQIPGRTIGILIDDIANVKGNNITVIFDCCYSAGCAREKLQGFMPRTVELGCSIPNDLDSDVWAGRASGIPVHFSHHGIRSHVLLAACGEREFAYESNGRGQFTRALLEALQNRARDTSLTYAQVLEGVHLEMQNPHCIGIHQHRVLFDVMVPAGKHVQYHARADGEGKCSVDAGLVHGVSHGAEFTLYDNQKRMLGTAVVDDTATIEGFRTTVTTSVQLTHIPGPFAKLTRVRFSQIPVYVASGVNVPAVFGTGTSARNFELVRDDKEAKIGVSMKDNRIAFTILDRQVTRFGLKKLLHTATLDMAPYVLDAVAHYYWYLHLTNNKNHNNAYDGVAVDFYRLERAFDDFDIMSSFERPVLTPITPGLCQNDPASDASSVINFVVDSYALYGIEIKNNTPRDLYLNVFLFNNSSLSIVPCYMPPRASKPEAPLKKGGTFTIGYGPGGTAPLGFSLAQGQDVDLAHLKIFFATQPIDLTDVVQMSPFADMNGMPFIDGDSRDGNPAHGGRRDVDDVWFTVVIPIVQRRALDVNV